MGKPELCKMLGVEPYGAFYFTAMRFEHWGAQVALEGYYEHVEPDTPPTHFRLSLQDCRELQ